MTGLNLDLKNFDESYFKNRFPSIYQICQERRIDLFNTGIPVSPAAHYSIGGVKSSLSGRTSVPGLWVVGEVSSNGFHGANRLASNSLLECIVVPGFLVNDLLKSNDVSLPEYSTVDINVDEVNYDEVEISNIIKELQIKNLENIGLIKEDLKLKEHLAWLNNISRHYNIELTSCNYLIQELKNMLLLSTLICNAALERRHSLGVHYRQDNQSFPVEFQHSVYCSNQLKWEINSSKQQLVAFSE